MTSWYTCVMRLTCRYGAKNGIVIVNESKKIIQVTVYYPRSVTAVDIGVCAVYDVPNDNGALRLTLSFYGESREMENLCTNCLFNNGRILHVRD